MAKGAPKPVTRERESQRSSTNDSLGPGQLETPTHECPVSEKEEFCQRVEGNVGARALGVVVRAGELSTGGGKATAGDKGGGHSGPESSSGIHLGERESEVIGLNTEHASTRTLKKAVAYGWGYQSTGRARRVERAAAGGSPDAGARDTPKRASFPGGEPAIARPNHTPPSQKKQ
ncbi:uncharacterized protein ATNIH1004_005021 [Aspergillus tanneri]|uniref:Uncharacterized protein n=1 Tax=Aspergillus tanneri TaxID=1220188 RepID=A0A5M9MT67_9EURO|nr:uncharacterized protein ATNIH1004_005021 [Aspergillus tanneri]KAA8649126.1 hypothetical protein ATNIH1004_005021 [Aspergillus tanneri]